MMNFFFRGSWLGTRFKNTSSCGGVRAGERREKNKEREWIMKSSTRIYFNFRKFLEKV